MYSKGTGAANEDDNQSSSGGHRQGLGNERCLGERRQLAWYLTEEGARDIQANIPDLQPLPPINTRIIQTQEPAREYKRIQKEAHTYLINVDTAYALERIAGTMETTAIKNAVSALTEAKPSRQEDYCKKPMNSSAYSDTQSEESDEDIIVDPGWDDFCLTGSNVMIKKKNFQKKKNFLTHSSKGKWKKFWQMKVLTHSSKGKFLIFF
ncbi:hypothetical protein Tco_1529036 [Tanacetum coccineum]